MFKKKVKNGDLEVDPFTGRKVSNEAYKAASNAIAAFSAIIEAKKAAIELKYQTGSISKEEYQKFQKMIKDAENEDVNLPSSSGNSSSNSKKNK